MAEALSRKQMEDRIAALEARNSELESAPPASPVPAIQASADSEVLRQMSAMRAEIDALRTAAAAGPAKQQKVVDPVPYTGYVKAKEGCFAGEPCGRHDEGDVFLVNVPGLWTDDPFDPVIVVGQHVERDGAVVQITEPNPDAKVFNFLYRRQISVNTDLEPLRASQF